MKTTARKVRNIRWRKSRISGHNFRTGEVTIKRKPVMVFDADGTWLTANPEFFLP